MALTKHQTSRIKRHLGEMAFIGAIILILWAVIAIAKSQGL